MIGVIGGMGPLATADFVHKVIEATPARDDEDHVPLLISSDPRIPRRPAAILHGGESPLPRLRDIRDRLVAAGAQALVMPCNTAHFWHAELLQGCGVPFPSIVDAACDEALLSTGAGGRVGLIATRATLVANLYGPALRARGLQPVLPTDELLDAAVLPAIAAVKAGSLPASGELMGGAVRRLLDQGCDRVILACTEAPVALAASTLRLEANCVDPTAALARATVALWAELRGATAPVRS